MKLENYLTLTERWSLAAQSSEKFMQLDNSHKNKLAIRITGFAILAFASLVDAFVHMTLAIKKIVIGAVISFPKTLIGKSIEINQQFSSGLIHLLFTIESVFNVAILPLIYFIDPATAYRLMLPRLKDQKIVKEDCITEILQESDSLNISKNLSDKTIETINQDEILNLQTTHDSEKQALENLLQQRQKELAHLKILLETKEKENKILLSNNSSEIQQNILQLQDYNKQITEKYQKLKIDFDAQVENHQTLYFENAQLESKLLELYEQLSERQNKNSIN